MVGNYDEVDETHRADEAVLPNGLPTPPYMSYRGLLNLLDRLETDGVPQVFDRSFFGQQSGSLTAQTRVTLKFFDLIDEEKRPTDVLRTLVADEEVSRKTALRAMAEERYADVAQLGHDATHGQLQDAFKSRGLTGATVQKAIGFYLALAEDVGMEVSPHFHRRRVVIVTGNGTRRTTRKRKAKEEPAADVPVRTLPPTVTSMETKKSAYIDMLMTLAQKSEEAVPAELLDRIERALGFPGTEPAGGP